MCVITKRLGGLGRVRSVGMLGLYRDLGARLLGKRNLTYLGLIGPTTSVVLDAEFVELAGKMQFPGAVVMPNIHSPTNIVKK